MCGGSKNVRITDRGVEVPGVSIPTAPIVPAEPPSQKHGSSVLTNQGVIDMVEAHVPEAVIIGQIKASKTKFDLSTHGIIDLSKGEVTEAVIEAMRKAGAAAPAAAVPAVDAGADPENTRRVPLIGGVPFQITLTADVPYDPADGLELHFHASRDYEVDGAVVIAKGATVTGEVVRMGRKKLFRLMAADAVDGAKLKVKATAGRGSDGNENNIEPPGHRGKDSLAPKGSTYLAYFDGDQTAAVKK
jgi:hypothetical protein